MASVLQLLALALVVAGVFVIFGGGWALVAAGVAVFAVGFALERQSVET